MSEKRFRVTIGNENDARLVDYIDNRQLISISFKEHKDAVNCRDALLYQCNMMNELYEENEELKSKYSEQCIQLDFLKDENQHMRDLVNENEQLQERNNRQAKQLGNIYHLIEKQDWKTLKGIIEEFKECEEQLQREWKCYE